MLDLLGRLLCLAFAASTASAGTYYQTESYAGGDFLNGFHYEAIPDPTHGRVNYVDGDTAAQQNLTYARGNHFIMRADFTTYLDPNGPGRNSVRLKSNNQYSTSVMIFNVHHMPTGCGTWPAIWTVGDNWPYEGEIDLLEGVNDVGPNQVTLHTGSGCAMPSSRGESGTPVSNNCDTAATNNVGCGVRLSDSTSYGPDFNSNDGGWLAMEWTDDFIKGTPGAYFPSDSCSISSKFGPQYIMFDLTFCGDWAGHVYSQSGCPSTCIDFVNNNPSAFKEAYFDFEWLKIYS